MKFILHSEIDATSIRNSLGKPEYSYYFVLRAFQPVLEQIGTVELVRDPIAEVDAIYEASAACGEDCVFISFSPPNMVPLGLKCPTICVVAWEFSTIPDGGWNPAEPREDWRYVFGRLGTAISLSNHTARVVKAAMTPDFPIFAVAAPVYDRVRKLSVPTSGGVIPTTGIAIRGAVFDTRDYVLAPEQVLGPIFPPPPIRPTPWERAVARQQELDAIAHQRWAEERARVEEAARVQQEEAARQREEEACRREEEARQRDAEAREHEAEALRQRAEDDARRREAEEARIHAATAAYRRTLRFRLAVTKRHMLEWYREAVRDLLPRWLARIIGRIGGLTEAIYRRMTGWKPAPAFVVQPALAPEAAIVVQEAPPEPLPPLAEPQPESVAMPEPLPFPPPPQPVIPEVPVSLGGVVYTAMLNPTDGRKNWHDILSAFCWTFREAEDATLVLKMVKGDPSSYRRDLFLILARSAPFKCRVVAMDGFLDDADYAALMGATSFYVNASNAEGLCMPLMEFMSIGKPVIAPCHTAMADYIDPSAAFVLETAPEHNVWPNDPRHLYTTMRERLKWDTLAAALAESYRVAKEEPERYAQMGAAAEGIMRGYCSDDAVRERLRYIMQRVVEARQPEQRCEAETVLEQEPETA